MWLRLYPVWLVVFGVMGSIPKHDAHLYIYIYIYLSENSDMPRAKALGNHYCIQNVSRDLHVVARSQGLFIVVQFLQIIDLNQL